MGIHGLTAGRQISGWKVTRIWCERIPAKLTKQDSYYRQARGLRHHLMMEEELDQTWNVVRQEGGGFWITWLSGVPIKLDFTRSAKIGLGESSGAWLKLLKQRICQGLGPGKNFTHKQGLVWLQSEASARGGSRGLSNQPAHGWATRGRGRPNLSANSKQCGLIAHYKDKHG